MEKGNAIKWILILVAIVVVAFAGIKIFGSFSAKGNVVQDTIILTGEVKEFNIKAFQWGYEPDTITVNKGDRVKIIAESLDTPHGLAINEFGVNLYLDGLSSKTAEFVADKTGTFTFYCNIPCGSGHSSMRGRLIVK